MISPKKTFLTLLAVFFLLGVGNLILPLKIMITDTLYLSNFNMGHFFVPPPQKHVDIAKITERVLVDSLQMAQPESLDKVTAPRDSIYGIQYPAGNDSILAPFFASLTSLADSNTGHYRVLHFGDSQIEGDRITGVLRSMFQDKFGGCGTGMLHITDPMKVRHSHVLKGNHSWEKKPAYGPAGIGKNSKYFGMMASYFLADTLYNQSDVLISKTHQARKNEIKAQQVKLLYINHGDSSAKVSQNKIPLKCVEEDDFLAIFDLAEHKSDNVTLHLKEKNHKIIHGVSFDCKSGITFDNVPMRGSSGTEFTKINPFLLNTQLKKLNTKLIIFQFGVNVVPNVLSNYKFYEDLLYKQLMFFKNNTPGIPILVVGVSDMSKKEGDIYVSYPNVPLIRDAQKNAAFRAGCAFWDLYTNMGGENSMTSWVEAKPALANKDYTHFTNTGASYVGKMLYKALIDEYDRQKN